MRTYNIRIENDPRARTSETKPAIDPALSSGRRFRGAESSRSSWKGQRPNCPRGTAAPSKR